MFLSVLITGFTSPILGVAFWLLINKFVSSNGTLLRELTNYFLKIIALLIAFFAPIFVSIRFFM